MIAIACSGNLQVMSGKLSIGVNSVDTLAVCETRSILSLVASGIKVFLGNDGTNLTLRAAGINSAKNMTSEKVPVIVSANNYDENVTFHVYPNMYLQNLMYDYTQIKQKLRQLNVLPSESVDFI